MGRQMRFYLLPQETEELLSTLRSEIGMDIYAAATPEPSPERLKLFSNAHLQTGADGLRSRSRVYLAPPDRLSPAIRTREAGAAWHIDSESDVIEFDSCAFDAERVVQGRMYYQADRLVDGDIVPKNLEFVRWAERAFRVSKGTVRWFNELHAYVGRDAELWRQQGGIFLDFAGWLRLQRKTQTNLIM